MSDTANNILPRLGHGAKLNRLGLMAARCLVTEPTFADAARKAGVAVSTLARWLQRPDFQRLVERARAECEARQQQRRLAIDERQSRAKINDYLLALPDVQERRRGTYVATCPVCGVKGSLHLWQREFGGVVMKCQKTKCPQLKIEAVLFSKETA